MLKRCRTNHSFEETHILTFSLCHLLGIPYCNSCGLWLAFKRVSVSVTQRQGLDHRRNSNARRKWGEWENYQEQMVEKGQLSGNSIITVPGLNYLQLSCKKGSTRRYRIPSELRIHVGFVSMAMTHWVPGMALKWSYTSMA